MTKKEFQNKVKTMNYVPKKDSTEYNKRFEYYLERDKFHILACYRNDDNQYVVFFKDLEREISKEIGKYITAEEAYDAMWEYLENN